jgi:hypothetical protein
MTSANRPGGRQFPVEVLLVGAACAACCLPLLGAVVAAGAVALAGVGAALAGLGPGLAVGVAATVALMSFIGWRQVQRARRACPNCGARSCAC